ncbi:MAG TPA: hypothetical protein VEC37_09155 [Bacillota bacterium]|nr:hypothetical protein [Bacillota bacterium]
MEIIDVLNQWYELRKGEGVDLEMFGGIFGGRIGEATQQVESFSFADNRLEFRFNPTEQLEIINPQGVTLERCRLVIARADEVRWGWHYYGNPKTDENWCTIQYIVKEDHIDWTVTGKINHSEGPVTQGQMPLGDKPAVVLFWW